VNDFKRRFVLLWVAVGVVGVLLAGLFFISFRIARRANEHMVRHKAITVVSGMRSAMMYSRRMGNMSPEVLQDALSTLLSPGVLHLGLVDEGLKYIASSEPDEVGKPSPFKMVKRAFILHKRLSAEIKWHGKNAKVFLFPRPHPRMCRSGWKGTCRMGESPFAMEVVVSTDWPAWMKTWLIMMVVAVLFTIFLLVLFAGLIKKQTIRADHLLIQTQKNRELQRLGELSAMVAHQLRNPLAGIKGNLQLGIERLKAGRMDDAIKDLDVSLGQIDRIEALVKNLLDFTRKLEIRRQAVNMAGLVSNVATEFEQQGHGIEVEAKDNAECVVDPTLIRQVLVNLINNAIESAGKDAGILIRVESGRLGCVLKVEDNGPGISPDMLEKVFDPFVSTRAKGSGLGLALVARVIQAHGGTVKAGHSDDLGGAMFTVTLPTEAVND